MPNEEFKQLYERYLQNDLSKEELSRFLSMLHAGQHEQEVDGLMEDTWKQMFTVPGVKQGRIISLNRLRYRVAAASAIILLFVTTAWFLFFNHRAKQDMTKAEKLILQDVNAPAVARAMLKLNDGTIVYLDSARNGSLAVQGNVDILKTGDGQLVYDDHPVTTQNSPLTYNTLINPRGSKVVSLTLVDGTRVWLNSESSLRYPTAFAGNERKVEITGEAYFEVAHNAAMPFKVKKGDVEVQVLGTHFNVNSYDDEEDIKVTLLEGSVKVNRGPQAGSRESVTIKPGEQAVVTSRSPLTISHSPDLENVMAWKNGKFSFHDMDLETIMRQIARWYDVDVEYRNKIGDNYTVDISREIPVSQLFKFIEMSGGVHFGIEGKKIIIKK